MDDAYISYRYAENLARGEGLVYNPGERVEGYTNFLWTVLLAGAATLGLSVDTAAKILGVTSACAALWPTYLLSRRLRPFTNVPCLATWLLATSFLVTGYAVFGLETPLFLLLVVGGTEIFLREEDAAAASSARRLPLSGLVFALAALTRPEAPLFLGMLVLWHRDALFTRRNLLRLLAFALPVVAHLAFRKAYYGAWVPNTLAAKTGDITQQLRSGSDYLRNYLSHAGPAIWLGIGSIAGALVRGRRDALAIASIAILFGTYVLLVGGDWMPYFRFLAPAEPFLFLLVDDAARALADRRERTARVAVLGFLFVVALWRAGTLSAAQAGILRNDKGFWDDAAGRTAQWFVDNTEPGPIAVADIGYIGYRTGYPIVDMLGLLNTDVSHLPGGYTRKTGAGYTDIVFGKNPRYFVIIASGTDCKNPTVPSSRVSTSDPRFRKDYRLRHPMQLRGGAAWCIYEKTKWP
ncbi:hypothetical protein [Chondromyces crocatus]|uniref:Glycosyltransferase RgtA/B/C/D-like domain-containing protein n=1 Tax=Chondromyces crocatus TaxID=52 RepID=A0A0K1EKJ3_CHOCO|nr:hypothetical protein [Chondromyces crocatus]AKT41389.1 uncharacterized protein CMC5_055890 [Chondromyces crocatus]